MSMEAFPDSLWFHSPPILKAITGYSRCLQIRIWWGLYQPGSGKAEHTAEPEQVMPHRQSLPTTWNSSVPQAIALLAFFFPLSFPSQPQLLPLATTTFPLNSFLRGGKCHPSPHSWLAANLAWLNLPSAVFWASSTQFYVQKALDIKGTSQTDLSWRPHPGYTLSFIGIWNGRSKGVDLIFTNHSFGLLVCFDCFYSELPVRVAKWKLDSQNIYIC